VIEILKTYGPWTAGILWTIGNMLWAGWVTRNIQTFRREIRIHKWAERFYTDEEVH
jgi:hypothetical protein